MNATPDIDISLAETPADIAAVKAVFTDYLTFIEAYLGQSLAFQNTAREFSDFPHTYNALWLAKLGSAPVAACGIKPFRGDICELKRLYCRPTGRGFGLGYRLCEAAIKAAREMGYKHIYLDTDHGLTHANQIYEQLGFIDIEKYYDNPMESRFMGLKL
jgi:GNAT superfamily N-acetyltransferase